MDDDRTGRVRHAIAFYLLWEGMPGDALIGDLRNHTESITKRVMAALDDPDALTLRAAYHPPEPAGEK